MSPENRFLLTILNAIRPLFDKFTIKEAHEHILRINGLLEDTPFKLFLYSHGVDVMTIPEIWTKKPLQNLEEAVREKKEIDKISLFCSHLAPPHNQGKKAGRKSATYNLGSDDCPFLLSPNNVLDLFCDMDAVAQEDCFFGDAGNLIPESRIRYFIVREERTVISGKHRTVVARVAPYDMK